MAPRPNLGSASPGAQALDRAERRQLFDLYADQAKRLAFVVHFQVGIPLHELVMTIAHADSMAAVVVAGGFRDDYEWIERERGAATLAGRPPAIVDVLVGELGNDFLETFVSDAGIAYIRERPVDTVPVAVVGADGNLSVILAKLGLNALGSAQS